MVNKRTIIFLIANCLIISIIGVSLIFVLRERPKNTGLDFCDEDIIVIIDGTIAKVDARYGLHNRGDNSTFIIILPFASKPWNISLTMNGQVLRMCCC